MRLCALQVQSTPERKPLGGASSTSSLLAANSLETPVNGRTFLPFKMSNNIKKASILTIDKIIPPQQYLDDHLRLYADLSLVPRHLTGGSEIP